MLDENTCPVPHLSTGTHAADSEERCVWEAVNYELTGKVTDRCPDCTHPALHLIILRANDSLCAGPRDGVWRYAVRALGSAARPNTEIARICAGSALKAADAAVRIYAPAALDAAGLVQDAAKLRGLGPIVDADSAHYAADSARCATYSAYSAARSAAYSADSADSADRATDSVTDSATYSAARSAYNAARSVVGADGVVGAAYTLALLEALLPGKGA